MRAGASGAGPCPRPLWPLKLSQPGEIGSTGCGLHPPGRSALPTARTPSHRCRRPPHRPNHHRASPAAGCAAIPYVAPQCSPHGIRDRATGRGPGRWAVGSGYGQAESPSSAAPRPGLLHVMTIMRTTVGINKAEDAGAAARTNQVRRCVAAGFADEADQLLRISWPDLPGDLVRPKFSSI